MLLGARFHGRTNCVLPPNSQQVAVKTPCPEAGTTPPAPCRIPTRHPVPSCKRIRTLPFDVQHDEQEASVAPPTGAPFGHYGSGRQQFPSKNPAGREKKQLQVAPACSRRT